MSLEKRPLFKAFSLKTIIFALYAVVVGFATGPVFAHDTPCDPQYMDALEARAWLEAQREIAQNQNLILKPDSVLELTCFDEFMDVLSQNYGVERNFSETTFWGIVDGFDEESLDVALTEVVSTTLFGWLENNFNHSYRGGREDDGADDEYELDDFEVIGTDEYNCAEMALVWEAAKCKGAIERGDFDGFYDFVWYTRNDPRDLPGDFEPWEACADQQPEFFEVVVEKIDIAYNAEAEFEGKSPSAGPEGYMLDPENPDDTAPYNVDPVITYLDRILPVGTTPAEGCAAPILTGVQVKRVNIPAYADAVCPNPGCHYTGVGGTCEE